MSLDITIRERVSSHILITGMVSNPKSVSVTIQVGGATYEICSSQSLDNFKKFQQDLQNALDRALSLKESLSVAYAQTLGTLEGEKKDAP